MPSSTYSLGVAIAKTISAHTKDFTAHVSPKGTSTVFPGLFQTKELDLAALDGSSAYLAANGLDEWKGQPMPVRILGFGAPAYYGIIATPKSGIKTPADLRGKKWMALLSGSRLLRDMADATMYAYGLTEKDVTVLPYSSIKEATEALKEGRVDALSYPYYDASPWLEELVLLGKAVIISDTEEIVKKINEKHPYFVRAVLPAGNYKGQDKEIVTFSAVATLSVRESLPTAQVYEITRILFDNFKEWKTYYEADVKYYELPDSIDARRMSVPMHEGALKYYREKGYWKAEHDAKQKALLAAIKK